MQKTGNKLVRKTNMATANYSEYTDFFLDEEDGSGTSSNSDQYCKISPNITTESFSAFLQTLLKVYKPPSSENCILNLVMCLQTLKIYIPLIGLFNDIISPKCTSNFPDISSIVTPNNLSHSFRSIEGTICSGREVVTFPRTVIS